VSERIDVEYHALRLGLKPAVRLTASPTEAPEMERRYRDLGLSVVTATATLHGRTLVVLYVAGNPAVAAELRDAEQLLLEGFLWDEAAREAAGVRTREVGRRLGYPDCCVEAFAARFERTSMRSQQNDDYLAARDAWVPAPRWQLNGLLRRWRRFVVSFEACRFDCPRALGWADELLRRIEPIDREARAALERRLRQDLAIASNGERVVVQLSPAGVIEAADAPSPAERDLAAALLGKRVDERGLVADTSSVLVVRFRSGAQPRGETR
jgi:hypothetical protein